MYESMSDRAAQDQGQVHVCIRVYLETACFSGES